MLWCPPAPSVLYLSGTTRTSRPVAGSTVLAGRVEADIRNTSWRPERRLRAVLEAVIGKVELVS